MALSAKLRKSINDAYDTLMFEKVDSRRIKEIDDDWVALSDFRVKHFDEKISIDVDIGLFSRRINEISNWFPPNILPGLIQCHFFSSVFELNEGKWKPEVSSTLFVPLDGDDQATAKFVKESIINNIP